MALAGMPPAPPALAQLATEARRAFWQRALACVVDLLVLSLITLAVNAVFGVTHVTSGSPIPPPGSGIAVYTTATDVGWGWLILIWLAYYAGLEALFGATVGKWLLHLRVTDAQGRRPRLRAIGARTVLRFVDALPFLYLIGGGSALVSPSRQRLGDRLARTLVLPHETLAAPLLTATQARRRLALAGGVIGAGLIFSAVFFYYGRPTLVIQSMANTRALIFDGGVSSYSLSAPTWGAGTVSYQIAYVTAHPGQTCHARLTLAWALPEGWTPRYAESSCATP